MINEPTPLELSENLVRRPLVMTIGGFDPSGAGLQADIETCSALGVHALPIVTAVTIQNTKSIERILPLAPDEVSAQITHLLADVAKPSVCKIGMLPNNEVLRAVIDTLNRWLPDISIVLDPILKSTSGTTFVDPAMLATLRTWLSRITLLKPNADEARAITDQSELSLAGKLLNNLGCRYVLISGTDEAEDGKVQNVLFHAGRVHQRYHWPLRKGTFHGSGCTLTTAIAAYLARGESLESAVNSAQAFTWRAINAGYSIGGKQAIPARAILPTHLSD